MQNINMLTQQFMTRTACKILRKNLKKKKEKKRYLDVAPLGYIIPIPHQPDFALSP